MNSYPTQKVYFRKNSDLTIHLVILGRFESEWRTTSQSEEGMLSKAPKQGDKLRFIVDDVRKVHAKGMLPGPDLTGVGSKIVDLGVDTVTQNLATLLGSVLTAVSSCPVENDKWNVETVRFTVAMTGAGEVSIISVVRGEISGETGLEFTLTRKR
ncbi:MAG TPA: hypothetical protein VFQ43_08030 [Nitrososphaera sp.]|nr:hypothetical protein [Nitrososphaera sp.]